MTRLTTLRRDQAPPMSILDDTTRLELITLLSPVFAREDGRRELLALALGADSPALRQIVGDEWQSPVEAFVLRLVGALARSGEAAAPALMKLLDFARERVTDDRRPRVAALAAMIPATTPTAAAKPLHLRVFLASPGDVSQERALALQVLGEIPYDPLLSGQATIETVAWDQPGGGTPLLTTMTPQAAMATGLPPPSACDIVVVIVWSRMGTPLPSDQYRKADGTAYLSGTEWEYLDALTAADRCGRPKILVYRRTEKCLLDPDDADFDDRKRQHDQVKAFFATFRKPDGSIRRGVNAYAAPAAFGRDLALHLRSLIRALLQERPAAATRSSPSTPPAPPLWPGSPFPGLRAFTPADAKIFCGRGRETDQLVRRLADGSRFLAVVDASGSGKSSLVAAGLIPRLADNAIEGAKDWLLPRVLPAGAANRCQWSGLRFTPGELGDDPFLALAARLAPLLPDEITPRELAAQLANHPASFVVEAAKILATQPAWANLLIFIDQFEELLTVVAGGRRAPFVELLAAAAEAPRLRLVVTMRADFYPRWLAWPRLPAVLCAEQLPVVAPGLAALFQMITAPAARAGLELDEGLAARILEETGSDSGALALLAFALHELYEARSEAGRLTHAAYDGFGGVRGAISRRAEKTWQALPPAAQALLQPVFADLVEVDERGVATRRRLPRSRLASSKAAERLLNAFIDARLLVSSQNVDGAGAVVEVAHEAMFREWPRLRDWISERADDLRLRREIEQAASGWKAHADAEAYRWSNDRVMREAAPALRRLANTFALGDSERSFLGPIESAEMDAELQNVTTSHAQRAIIGDRLNLLPGGHPRPGIGLKDGIPDIVWCAIPGGEVELELPASDEPDVLGEKLCFAVKPFEMARYPVTVVQWEAFVAAEGGYNARVNAVRGWTPNPQWGLPNYPAVLVNWVEAVAYCEWLSTVLKYEVRLPTEWEWQQAATGGDGHKKYPWGDWQEGRANSLHSRLGRAIAVGLYPDGASAHGVLDLAGNVWDWCLNKSKSPEDPTEDSNTPRVVRGGSWSGGIHRVECTIRSSDHPENRNLRKGFRLLRVSPVPA